MGFLPSPLPQPRRGQAWHVQQGSAKFRELELDISLLATGNFKNLWKIDIWAEEFFSRRRGLWIRCPQSAVHSLQSTVHSLYVVRFDAFCIVWLENRPFRRLFRLVSRVVIAMFWRAKPSFSRVKNAVFPHFQNMVHVWTQRAIWRKIFYLKMSRNISRGSYFHFENYRKGHALSGVRVFSSR